MSIDKAVVTIIAQDGYSIRPASEMLQKGFVPIASGRTAPVPKLIANPGATVQPPASKVKE